MRRISRTLSAGALLAAAILSFSPIAPAQQTAAYRAPRTKDGKPNISGIWQALNEGNWNIEAHNSEFGTVPLLGAINAVPPGLGIVEGGVLPYKPEALAQRKENFANRGKGDPEAKCYRLGVPRSMYAPYPFQILQSPDHIMMVFQFANSLRTIYMKDHVPAPAESWMGWSNGRWEGETLVIETTGFNGQTWLDRSGNYHSTKMKVVERITARSADTLNYEATIDDPEVYTRPWKISMPLYRRIEKDARVLEFKCIEYSEELIYGHLRKQPANP
jgi:hypothetical protein